MPIVSGKLFSETAYSYNGRGLTYQQYDCTHFTNLVRRTCALSNLQQGSNAMWRGNGLTWKGTIQEAYARFGGVLPQGLYLFHVIPDSSPDADPDHYGYGDGVGDVNHVGIYTNIGLGVMQSGGYDGTGVHDSRLRSYFNLAGCATGIDYTGRVEPEYPNPTLFRKFYMSPDRWLGEQSVQVEQPNYMLKQNANCIKSKFVNDLNWKLQAVCGIIGCFQAVSALNPAFISTANRNRLTDPNQLSKLPNYIMMDYNGNHYSDPNTQNYGIALAQWTTIARVNGLDQSYIVARAIVDHYNWYDGWFQCIRIKEERDNNGQTQRFVPTTVNGYTYTFENYVNSQANPSDCAEAWARGYLQNTAIIQTAQANATYWYNFFTSPNAPDPIEEPPIDPYTAPDFPWIIIFGRKRKELKKPCRTL